MTREPSSIADLEALARELEASRARIIEAGDAERRRLGRDLHDGAQQVLVGAVMSLKLARRRWDEDAEEARGFVDEALEQLQAGIQDLRELANGIHPSVLTDRGLGAALQALAGRSRVPVELGDVPDARLPEPVETTAYFVVAEGLANAAKHAGCSRVAIALGLDADSLTVEVRDDGTGGADAGAGSGLRGLADRVSGIGGSLEIDSPAGAGTTLVARIALSGRPAV